MNRLPLIAVIGSGATDGSSFETARAVGRCIGLARCHLICGGRGGVMAAACQGHREGRVGVDPRGVTIGVLPGSDAAEANPFVDVVIPTGFGLARNAIIVCAAEGVVAVAGGSGTLSEIALAWQMGRPIAVIASSGGWSERLAGEPLDDKRHDVLFDAATPEEAISFLLGRLRRET
jgi:hypothetical protein